jgi:ribosomal protein L40E
MASAGTSILVIVGVVLIVAVTALIVGGWLLVNAARFITGGIANLVGVTVSPRRPALQQQRPAQSLRCPRPRCHADNVPAARFCRRCGSPMAAGVQARPANVRRVAMW